MKIQLTKKAIVVIAALLLAAVAYGVYSRPMTIQQRYPMLTLDKCTGIQGYYQDDTHAELQEFSIDRNSEDFDKLWDLLYEREYRRSLKDLLVKGTRIHPSEPGNFRWDALFCFDTIELPDGNSAYGALLHFERWYDGELNISTVIGERKTCYYTDEQDTWAKEVFDIIR